MLVSFSVDPRRCAKDVEVKGSAIEFALYSRDRRRFSSLLTCGMTQISTIERLRPQWMKTAGALHKTHALVRSVCSTCGTEFREDTRDLVGRYGVAGSLIGRRERCRHVGCDGSMTFKASRTYGQPFTALFDVIGSKE